MSKSAFKITDNTKNVVFHPSENRVVAGDKDSPLLKRSAPKRPEQKPQQPKPDDKDE